MLSPTEDHWVLVKRILGHLIDTLVIVKCVLRYLKKTDLKVFFFTLLPLYNFTVTWKPTRLAAPTTANLPVAMLSTLVQILLAGVSRSKHR